MDRSSPPRRRLQTQYLIPYNLTCAILWLAVFGRVLLLVPLVGFDNVYGGVGSLVKWTQTLAVLEVVNSALGRFFGVTVFTSLGKLLGERYLIEGLRC